jgi:lysozyme
LAEAMRTSGVGLELIKSFEGFRARAAAISGGRFIVGYGHTDRARAGLKISRDDAELVLRFHDLAPIETLLHTHVLTPLTQHEFDALVSFAFNIGSDAFIASDVLMHLNSGDRMLAVDAMHDWRRGRVDGELRVIDALVRRRAAEIALFLEHPSGRIALPSAMIRAEQIAGAGRGLLRERAVIIDTQSGAERARPGRSTPEETPAQSAARAVTERLTRILGENAINAAGNAAGNAVGTGPGNGPAGADAADGPTPEEITRAIAELAGPDGPPAVAVLPKTLGGERADPAADRRKGPRRDPDAEVMPHPPGLGGLPGLPDFIEPLPPQNGVIDDLGPLDLPPIDLTRAAAETAQVRRAPPAAGLLSNVGQWLPYALLSGLGGAGVLAGALSMVNQARRPVASETDIYLNWVFVFGGGMLLVMSVYYLFRALTRKD